MSKSIAPLLRKSSKYVVRCHQLFERVSKVAIHQLRYWGIRRHLTQHRKRLKQLFIQPLDQGQTAGEVSPSSGGLVLLHVKPLQLGRRIRKSKTISTLNLNNLTGALILGVKSNHYSLKHQSGTFKNIKIHHTVPSYLSLVSCAFPQGFKKSLNKSSKH